MRTDAFRRVPPLVGAISTGGTMGRLVVLIAAALIAVALPSSAGAASWEPVFQTDAGPIFHSDPNHLWIECENYFHHTINGGLTWETVDPFLDQPWGRPIDGIVADFPTVRSGWVGGGIQISDDAYVVLSHTTDGGQSWQLASLSGPRGFVYAIDFYDANHGWVGIYVGNTPTVYYTSDAGTSWSASWPDDGVIVATGRKSALVLEGGLRREAVYTDDGGCSWQSTGVHLNRVTMTSATAGVGTYSTYDPAINGHHNRLYRTTDAGHSWSLRWEQADRARLLKPLFISARIGYVRRDQPAVTGVLTTDGGLTWQEASPPAWCPSWNSQYVEITAPHQTWASGWEGIWRYR
jgi:photosystem II stability/assembly factor-like uncharacterized protein